MILIANWEGTDCQIISVLHSVEIKTQIMLFSFRGVQFTTLQSRSKLKLTCFCFFIFQRQKLATFDSCKKYFCSCAETKTYNPDSLFFLDRCTVNTVTRKIRCSTPNKIQEGSSVCISQRNAMFLWPRQS